VEETITRDAVRVVLVDTDERVLLIEGHDPGRPDRGTYWFTPGGGIDPGETPQECAAREVLEETGLRLEHSQLGPVVRTEQVEFGFEGATIQQRQVFYLVQVEPLEVDTTGWTELERRAQLGTRWWTLAELATTRETVYPEDVVALVENAIRSGWA
jgi:8-oxo-dGTP pyrophosphatase MutT (NUDIX family)